MNEIILLKLGEMVLKGLNRRSFEDKLQANLHRRLRPFGQFRVYTRQSATYVEPIGEGCDVEGAYVALKHVFGIVGLSLARPCGKDKDAILACAKEFLDDQLRAARTFKVETKRADKTFPMTSIQLSQYVGGELHEAYDNLEVDVHHPELTVHVVPFTAIQEELRRSCPEELFTVIMRRFMMRIAQEVARRCGAKALVTGECLGQVASQTMDAMLVTGAVVDLPILRPVVGMDKEEIVQIARKIGTFETSILPYEDCCTVFTPRHPRLRPLPGEVEFAEEKLDIQALIQAAVDGIERVQV